jgi:hypothetical protein
MKASSEAIRKFGAIVLSGVEPRGARGSATSHNLYKLVEIIYFLFIFIKYLAIGHLIILLIA